MEVQRLAVTCVPASVSAAWTAAGGAVTVIMPAGAHARWSPLISYHIKLQLERSGLLPTLPHRRRTKRPVTRLLVGGREFVHAVYSTGGRWLDLAAAKERATTDVDSKLVTPGVFRAVGSRKGRSLEALNRDEAAKREWWLAHTWALPQPDGSSLYLDMSGNVIVYGSRLIGEEGAWNMSHQIDDSRGGKPAWENLLPECRAVNQGIRNMKYVQSYLYGHA